MYAAFFFALFAVAAAAPQPEQPEPVPILKQSQDIQPDGSFQWDFESADGTKQAQEGAPKPVTNGTAEVVIGSATWVDPEGGSHSLKYVADENGYQPQGNDVPAIPPQIARALDWIATHPQPEESSK